MFCARAESFSRGPPANFYKATRSVANISAECRRVTSGEEWRLLPYSLGTSAHHFALSDALLRCLDVPSVWWHSSDRPSLILGAGQDWDEIDRGACERAGIQVIRRQAGGTSVLAVPGVLGLDLALPSDHPLVLADVVENYRWLGQAWVDTLQALQVPAHLVSIPEARSAAPVHDNRDRFLRLACFGSLSPYEVTARGRKLVGLAQVRRKPGLLLQSGLHTHFDAALLAALLPTDDRVRAEEALRSVAVGTDELAPDLTAETVMSKWKQIVEDRLGVRLVPGEWSSEELLHATGVRVLAPTP